MEEKLGKSPRTTYIIAYSLFLASGLFFGAISVFAILMDNNPVEFPAWAYFGSVFGFVLAGVSIFLLIYFIRLPEYAITYKDGKLYFRNKLVCTPAELENFNSKGGGVDGAVFGFGRLIVVVNGKRYKFNYVNDVGGVVARLYAIKAEYTVQQHIAQNKAGEENG